MLSQLNCGVSIGILQRGCGPLCTDWLPPRENNKDTCLSGGNHAIVFHNVKYPIKCARCAHHNFVNVIQYTDTVEFFLFNLNGNMHNGNITCKLG